jgi:hypothetical protein
MIRRLALAPLALLLPLAIIAPDAAGETIHVTSGGSIQAAIDSATDGDVVVLAPGVYHETIDLRGLAITVRSDDPLDDAVVAATVIDAGGLGSSAVTCASGEWLDTRLEGLTITGGTGTPMGGLTHGGGMYVHAANPTVHRCVFTGNTADGGGGLFVRFAWYAEVVDCTFTGNTATGGGHFGGGGVMVRGGSPIIERCTITDNDAVGAAKGGGVMVVLGAPRILNCLVAGNTGRHGGGIMNDEGTPVLTSCTVFGNAAAGVGGGLRSVYAAATALVTNSIFWGNTAGDMGDEVLDQVDAVTTVQHSTVRGGWSGAGSDVGAGDPLFVDAAAGNFRLRAASPCIDAGLNDALDVDTDLDGNDRIVNGLVDLGAYETQGDVDPPCPADLDASGDVSLADLLLVLTAWGDCPACPADLDGDGGVSMDDLLLVLHAWGSCP